MSFNLSKIFGDTAKGAVSGVLDGAANIISKFKADPTKAIEAEAALEKLRLEAEKSAMELGVKLEELAVKEMESARNREIQIATSDKASWITRNTTAILALSFVGVTLALYTLSVLKAIQINKDILDDLRDIVILIMGYYFGSSLGSKQKQKQIEGMTKE